MNTDSNDGASGPQVPSVEHRPNDGQYVIELDGHTAFLNYELRGRTMVITHTAVPPEFEGRGIGSFLVKTVLDDARSRGLVVVPVCPFVRSYIRDNPEYRDLVNFDDPGARS